MSPIFPLWPDGYDDPPGAQQRPAVPHDPRGGRTSWMARGDCRGSDPELFFPISATGRAMAQIKAAKAVCGGCTVRSNCLSYALLAMPDGIWGGTTREERIAMRLRLLRARARVGARSRRHDPEVC